SSTNESVVARRNCCPASGSGTERSSSASIASRMAQQLTEAANAPEESRLLAKGKAPSAGMRAAVGLKPVRPQKAEGIRMEPPVSVPKAATAMPSATETPAPDDEPPGMRRLPRSQGELGVP